jgi:luciferase family oxidoreductase group 1
VSVGVLDLCKRSRAVDAAQSLAATLDLAVLADRLGYSRYWIAEHHTPDAAQASPEVLLPLLARATTRIRIGAGGILLSYYSPLKVAELFLTLEALFPGRIDLGICRGPGVSDPRIARALVEDHQDEMDAGAFERKAAALVGLMADAARHREGGLPVFPLGVRPPPIWMLGGGESSIRLATTLRLPYAYTLIFGGGLAAGVEFIDQYRRSLPAASRRGMPKPLVAVSVVCADTESRARQIDAELVAQGCFKSNIVGTPEQCAETITTFASLLDVREVLVTTFVVDPRARRGMLLRLAAALELAPTHLDRSRIQ